MPVYNEEEVVSDVIMSLLNQKVNSLNIEILAIDGRSDDSTSQIIKKLAMKDERIKYIINNERKTPAAFNIGLEKSQGDYVAILGAHSVYNYDYIQTCIEELERTKSVGCSGMVKTRSKSKDINSMIILWVLKSKFGVSGNSFRTMRSGYAESIPYPVFKKKALLEIGGYNESLLRNQDNDLNNRLIKKGYKLFTTDKTSCKYFVDYSFQKMFSYAFNNGKWNAKTLFVNYRALKFHHFVPAAFTIYVFTIPIVLYLLYSNPMLKVIYFYLAPLFIYFAISIYETSKCAIKYPSFSILKMPIIFFRFHFSYGLGTIRGLLN